eukprot:scaffold116618_cov22-Tisochrysis_lutea.AAC.5
MAFLPLDASYTHLKLTESKVPPQVRHSSAAAAGAADAKLPLLLPPPSPFPLPPAEQVAQRDGGEVEGSRRMAEAGNSRARGRKDDRETEP